MLTILLTIHENENFEYIKQAIRKTKTNYLTDSTDDQIIMYMKLG